MKFFKSYYTPGTQYSPGWFGTLYVGEAEVTVTLYNDEEGFCVGTIDTLVKGLKELSEREYAEILMNSDEVSPGIWTGVKLNSRWIGIKEVKNDGEILGSDVRR